MTAALLQEQGYEVTGITMRLWKETDRREPSTHSPLDAVEDAGRVCEVLKIPLRVVDYARPFKAAVVDYFIGAYSRGLTPNPCVVCNQAIKFGLLLDEVRASGAQFLATGHYARTGWRDGACHLLKGHDAKKDQSYFLYRLTQGQLAHIMFPLGGYTKEQVRRMAEEKGLPVAHRPESQETCFILDTDYRRFLREHAPEHIVPGLIFDSQGHVIGQHKGLPFYTIGQRTGLGIAAPHPLFVLDIDPDRNVLVAGPGAELGRSRLKAIEVSYVSGRGPEGKIDIIAKIRYNARGATAILTPLGQDMAAVTFSAPLRDITPGQSVVFYQDEEALGGGIIAGDRTDLMTS
jgi:tRNA-specific 2-thiouridylase